jgi:hypothetical protein
MKGKKFKRSMLEYSKVILSKMTFDRELLRKEYSKAIKHLNNEERIELRAWARAALGSHLALVEA